MFMNDPPKVMKSPACRQIFHVECLMRCWLRVLVGVGCDLVVECGVLMVMLVVFDVWCLG